jgi:phosphoglycerate dehydrogenase-like enzyme
VYGCGIMKVVVSGVPRGFQNPRPNGNWLTEEHRRRIKAVSSDIDLVEMSQGEVQKVEGNVEGVEVLLSEGGNRTHYGEELDWEDYLKFFTPSLEWVMLCSTGFSQNIAPAIARGEVTLTNSPGIHTIPISEGVLAAMLDHAKLLQQRRKDQRERLWAQRKCTELHGATVLLIGLGNIGRRVAHLCKTFGMRVTGTKRRMEPVEGVDLVFPANELAKNLPEADYVVVAAPITPLTERMLGEREFRAMKETAYLINVGRGRIVDESVMVKALKEKWIGGAYLDCHVKEPLPQDHPLWSIENAFVVAHDSHSSPYIGDRIVDIFCDNLKRYLKGEPLLNICDPKKGY